MRVSIDWAWVIAQAASTASAAVPANRMCLIIDASWIWCHLSSLYLLDIAGFPAFVDRRFGRAVEPQNREIAFAGQRLQPVALLAVRRFGAEIDIGRTVGVCRRFVARAERGEGLSIGKARGVLGFVQRHRPEVGRGNVGREGEAITRP